MSQFLTASATISNDWSLGGSGSPATAHAAVGQIISESDEDTSYIHSSTEDDICKVNFPTPHVIPVHRKLRIILVLLPMAPEQSF